MAVRSERRRLSRCWICTEASGTVTRRLSRTEPSCAFGKAESSIGFCRKPSQSVSKWRSLTCTDCTAQDWSNHILNLLLPGTFPCRKHLAPQDRNTHVMCALSICASVESVQIPPRHPTLYVHRLESFRRAICEAMHFSDHPKALQGAI